MVPSSRVLVWAVCFCPISSFLLAHPRPKGSQTATRSTWTPPSRLNVIPDEYYFGNNPTGDRQDFQKNTSAFLTALAIVPATEDWDRIQRARHFARDPVFHEWPPCLRLFHPFSSTALEVAEVIEELEIEPFEIKLNTWVIVPHMEALEAEWQTAQAAPSVLDASQNPNSFVEEDKAVRELIEREEQLALEKSLARRKKSLKKDSTQVQRPMPSPSEEKKSPARVLEQQQEQYEEFGGPCVLCLEPDAESKQALIEFREALQEVLQHDAYSSPSSVYSWSFVQQNLDLGYRPLVPISRFESLQSALEVARRLKGLWGKPLTLTVNALDIISCKDDDQEDEYAPQSVAEWNKMPWGCNAKIKLLGEELEQDEDGNEKMVQELVEEGNIGGMDISMDFTILDDEEEALSDIEHWLDNDEEWDEGMQVVIGRTQFLTGDKRIYQGMPASSVVDAKDRSMGEGGVVSGLARRRRTVSRQGGLWEEGEFGRRDHDYLPWNKKERPRKTARLLDELEEG